MVKSNLLIVFGLLCIYSTVHSKQYCSTDDDCASLGDLVCTRSLCVWGVCGCPRGQTAKFVGDDLKFKCITLKRIGQQCSSSGTEGNCGPENSECRDNICQCTEGYVSIWNGERCVTSPNDNPYPGESCTTDNCYNSNCIQGEAWFEPLRGLAGTCTCGEGQRVSLSNELGASMFVGKRAPACVNNKLGDFCLENADCTQIAGEVPAECNIATNQCVCTNNRVASVDGTRCYQENRVFLSRGDPCDENDVCDPRDNIVCGDVCNLEMYKGGSVDNKCVCAPGYRESGAACAIIEEGYDCLGDYNCKSLGENAICVDGECQTDSAVRIASTWMVAVGLIVIMMNNVL